MRTVVENMALSVSQLPFFEQMKAKPASLLLLLLTVPILYCTSTWAKSTKFSKIVVVMLIATWRYWASLSLPNQACKWSYSLKWLGCTKYELGYETPFWRRMNEQASHGNNAMVMMRQIESLKFWNISRIVLERMHVSVISYFLRKVISHHYCSL